MKKRFLFFGFFLVFFAAFLAAQSSRIGPADMLDIGEARLDSLLRGETVTVVQQKDLKPELLPLHAYIQALTGGIMRDLAPSILAETLSVYRKPAGAAPGAWTAGERRSLYNRALALSTLTGLQYFSARRNAVRTLYERSVVIDGPESRRPLPDPVFSLPPESLTIYAMQKDTTFGENYYRYDYYARPDALIFVQENLSAMTAGIVPAIGKNRLRSILAVIDAGDYLLIYASSMAKTASFPGMARQATLSFSARTEAILTWFLGQADKAFEN
jgi:hypothetical protein